MGETIGGKATRPLALESPLFKILLLTPEVVVDFFIVLVGMLGVTILLGTRQNSYRRRVVD